MHGQRGSKKQRGCVGGWICKGVSVNVSGEG